MHGSVLTLLLLLGTTTSAAADVALKQRMRWVVVARVSRFVDFATVLGRCVYYCAVEIHRFCLLPVAFFPSLNHCSTLQHLVGQRSRGCRPSAGGGRHAVASSGLLPNGPAV